jgi:hypothetical protein
MIFHQFENTDQPVITNNILFNLAIFPLKICLNFNDYCFNGNDLVSIKLVF